MALPLLERATAGGGQFALVQLEPLEQRIPARQPAEGEQYRFHFDMTLCIGCKCCEVACNEQNGNPASIRWRRVGEIEGGEYPFTTRSYLSMGCNHCLDAACLQGCPVDAYRKDPVTGIVLHDANACIGCQYCTWNCPYGVPQYNPDRGIVGKCDMCYDRLAESREPACVSACPQGAIQVEIVAIEEWRNELTVSGNAPGMPAAEATLSTTRITHKDVAPDFRKADYYRVRPEHPHWPLVILLVLTQMSVGAFAAGAPVLPAIIAAHLALGASLLHLGRPFYAWRALKMWRRSWLSREVLAFSIYAGVATPAIIEPRLIPFAVLAGCVGIYCSARIYTVPARPSWYSWRTIAEFFLTAAALGPLLAGRFELALAGCTAAAIMQVAKPLVMRRSDEFELRQSARLLSIDFKKILWLRVALLLIAPWLPLPAGVAVGLAAEIIGRYLFFVTVVPRNIAATFFGSAREAA